jgi:hypothetical protein
VPKKKELKDSRVHVRVPKRTKRGIMAYADKHDVSLSDLVTRFFDNLIEYDKRAENKAAPGDVPDKFF